MSGFFFWTGRAVVECEQGVYHFQRLLKAAYRGRLLPESEWKNRV